MTRPPFEKNLHFQIVTTQLHKKEPGGRRKKRKILTRNSRRNGNRVHNKNTELDMVNKAV